MRSSARHVLLHLRTPSVMAHASTAGSAKRSRLKVGILDLGAWLGSLPRVLTEMNRVQRTYLFFTVQATVPVGLIRRREGVVAWIHERRGTALTPDETNEAMTSMVADDFFAIADPIRTELGLDYLVGVT